MTSRPVRHFLAAGAILLAALLALAGPFSLSSAREAPGPVEIRASAILNFRIASTETRFGAFDFVGGLELHSGARPFGGFSGIRLLPGRDRFLAVSDRGSWLSGTIGRDIAGVPRDISGAAMGPLLPQDASVVVRKFLADCEAIELDGDVAWLTFERNHRLARMPLAGGLPAGPAEDVNTKFSRLKLAANKGLEALAKFPQDSAHAGALLAISEESLNGDGNIRGFIVAGQDISEFAVLREGEFAVTDADFLPSGDLLLLERSFSLKQGPAMRIRRIAGGEINAGATLSGQTLLSADSSYRIDNMEGLDVSTDSAGDVHVTLISDDNFSPLQRTILLEFRLVE